MSSINYFLPFMHFPGPFFYLHCNNLPPYIYIPLVSAFPLDFSFSIFYKTRFWQLFITFSLYIFNYFPAPPSYYLASLLFFSSRLQPSSIFFSNIYSICRHRLLITSSCFSFVTFSFKFTYTHFILVVFVFLVFFSFFPM